MKPTYEDNKNRLAATAARRAKVLALLQDYLSRSGMYLADFAQQINYAHSTLRHFNKGTYYLVAGSDDQLTNAIEKFIAAHPIGEERADLGQLFETANVKLIRQTFEKLLPRPRAFMIYAPPGSQKTFVLEHQVAELNRRELSKNGAGRRAYYVYARQNIRPTDLMRRIAIACGSQADGTIDRILQNLRMAFRNRRVLLVIDEAQHVSLECFEIIRELLDQPPFFSLLLAGSHDLYTKFDRNSATLEQWNSRIAQKVRLPGVTREEALAIVEREVGHILRSGKGKKSPDQIAKRFVTLATVVDGYTVVARGEPPATYINIRTLSNSLDDFKAQHAAATAKGSEA